ncbi:MAG: M14 family zinc carboxypeptidase, partial [Anaerolineaceae bacterium]
MKYDQVIKLMQEVPDYQAFLTVDELNESMHRLAERFPSVVELIPLGESRGGTAIHAMKIGSGRKTGLLYAMPHPNEPIGSMMLEFLTTRLAEDDALRAELDYTWYIIKCIDVDGTRLNEGWFKGPFSVTRYARNFFRPPGHLQVEWTFPVDYKDLHFNQPLPETRALMNIIELVKPDFIYSLHNSGFGGVYAYLTHDIPAFYEDFYRLVESQNLPLHMGEAEVPYAQTFSKAIFGEIKIKSAYDFLEQNGADNPAELINSGESSFDYARCFCDPHAIVCEMPYFYNPAIHDTSPSDMRRRDALLAGLERSKEDGAFLQSLFEEVKGLLTIRSPYLENIEANLEHQEEFLTAQENWAKSDLSLDAIATVAEKFDNLIIRRFYHLLSVGMFVRMLEEEIAVSGRPPELEQALQTILARFEQAAASLK